ncbi:MAG: AzlC family ABC transporter permease [Paracoccaceae bacterium]
MTLPKAAFLRGLTHSLPFVLVILPFGMLYGVISAEAGLTGFETMAFTLSVFAGASQFAALQLMQDQAPVLVILATALAVNLRMVMYSVALTPHLGAAPLGVRAALSYFLVDQPFALCSVEFERRAMTLDEKVAYFAGSVTVIAPLWNLSAWAGFKAGNAIPPEYALDFAMPITFLAMTAPLMRSVPHAAAAVTSALGAVALVWLPYGTGVLVAAAVAMAVGAGTEIAMQKKRAAA